MSSSSSSSSSSHSMVREKSTPPTSPLLRGRSPYQRDEMQSRMAERGRSKTKRSRTLGRVAILLIVVIILVFVGRDRVCGEKCQQTTDWIESSARKTGEYVGGGSVIPHFHGGEEYEREKALQAEREQRLRENEEMDRIAEQQQKEKDEKTMIVGKKALLAYVRGNTQEGEPEEPASPTPQNENAGGEVHVEVVRSGAANGDVDNAESGNGGVHDGVSRAGMVEAMGGQGGQGEVLMKDGRKEVLDEPPHVHVGDQQAEEVLESEDVGVMGMDMGF